MARAVWHIPFPAAKPKENAHGSKPTGYPHYTYSFLLQSEHFTVAGGIWLRKKCSQVHSLRIFFSGGLWSSMLKAPQQREKLIVLWVDKNNTNKKFGSSYGTSGKLQNKVSHSNIFPREHTTTLWYEYQYLKWLVWLPATTIICSLFPSSHTPGESNLTGAQKLVSTKIWIRILTLVHGLALIF